MEHEAFAIRPLRTTGDRPVPMPVLPRLESILTSENEMSRANPSQQELMRQQRRLIVMKDKELGRQRRCATPHRLQELLMRRQKELEKNRQQVTYHQLLAEEDLDQLSTKEEIALKAKEQYMQDIKTQTFEEAVLQTPLDAAASLIKTRQDIEKSHLFTYLLPPAVPIPRNGWNVKDITLNELRPHFNKPMAAVAQEMGVCITLMKKICRKNGLTRWPHRRIRSLVNRITSLQAVAESVVEKPEKLRFDAHIASLRRELSDVIQNPNGKSRKAQEYERRKDEGSSTSDDTDNSSELRTIIHARDMDLSCFEVLEKVRGSISSLLCD